MTDDLRLHAPWLLDPGVRQVLATLGAEGATARFVGGCVRDGLIGLPSLDLDIAVDIPPERSRRLLEAAGLRVIPTGMDHGTVTALAPTEQGEPQAIEITSLRRDVSTDGRRATVRYTTDWTEDAARRDFTINALYADGEGRVYDPLGEGVADLEARRLRFVGRPQDRIREDYLRILRFFRFAARYAEGALDAEALAACAALKDGVSGLARERVGQEMRKLLGAPDPAAALCAMAETGALEMALPGADLDRIAPLIEAERAAAIEPSWLRRLAALAPRSEPSAVADALRLSNAEETALAARFAAWTLPPIEAGWRHGREAARDTLLLRQAEGEPASEQDWRDADTGANAEQPVRAQDLIEQGLAPGPALGEALRTAERAWLDSGLTLDREALLCIALDKGQQ